MLLFSSYPRLYRLGLIEARSGSVCGRHRPGRIRGFIASASLKQHIRFIGLDDDAEYPRLYRLGLIEATELAPSVMSAATTYPRLYRLGLIEALRKNGADRQGRNCIRGFIASASLKHIIIVSVVSSVIGIRGFIASASLKPRKRMKDSRSSCKVSEALSPRPH